MLMNNGLFKYVLQNLTIMQGIHNHLVQGV